MKQILVSAHAFNMATILVKGAYAWPESHTMLTQPIDVWWVVHDGGLLLLLSVILRKHRTWHRAPLRVFCVCHADDDPLALHASIKAFLYEMRISAKLQVVQISEGEGLDALCPTRGANWDGAKPRYNKAIVARPLGTLHFGANPSSPNQEEQQAEQDEEAQHTLQENSEQVIREVMTEQDRAAVADLEPKMRTTLAFNHVMRKHSHNAALVMTNLPVPRDEDQTTQAYMEHLALLMNNIPRALLVAGQKDADVITKYS